MTHIRGMVRKPTDPEALAASLPRELRSFRGLGQPDDYRAHMAAVAAFVGSDDIALPVMNAAGLSVADWYRKALTAC